MTCVFLDFSKAFDSVTHGHLLLKQEFLSVRGNFLQRFNSFLTYRFQEVVLGGQYSEWSPVISGYPRDQSWGPYYLFCM